jgi:hypothetical protein
LELLPERMSILLAQYVTAAWTVAATPAQAVASAVADLPEFFLLARPDEGFGRVFDFRCAARTVVFFISKALLYIPSFKEEH